MYSMAEKCQNMQIDPFIFVIFASQRHTLNLRLHLEINEYCEGQNLAKCYNAKNKGKRKVLGVLQSQAAAQCRDKEEVETDKTKQAQIKQTYKKH